MAPPTVIHAPTSPLGPVVQTCVRVAKSEATVLLTGETGTGKEVFAKLIHAESDRASAPFVPVNCGAIPEALLESELFGHAKGAFTGAHTARKGRLAAADGGTLFLDEIGELPLSMQVKLLRVLQERTYEPVGSTETRRANFRLVAATNRDLAKEVEEGRFRRDLYYRLFVLPIQLPALRARRVDLPQLFMHFWHKIGETRTVHPGVFDALGRYEWPGNVRELENLVERVSVCTVGSEVTAAKLPPPFGPGGMMGMAGFGAGAQVVPFPSAVDGAANPQTVLAADATDTAADASPAPASGRADLDALLDRIRGDATAIELPFEEALFALFERESFPMPLAKLLSRIENHFVDKALVQTAGNKKAAAQILGLQRTTLVEKLRRRERAERRSLAAVTDARA